MKNAETKTPNQMKDINNVLHLFFTDEESFYKAKDFFDIKSDFYYETFDGNDLTFEFPVQGYDDMVSTKQAIEEELAYRTKLRNYYFSF
jgi:hypothetical protein